MLIKIHRENGHCIHNGALNGRELLRAMNVSQSTGLGIEGKYKKS